MKKGLFVFGFILVIIMTSGLAGCAMDVDPNLVGKWYSSKQAAQNGGSIGLVYEFTSDGKILYLGIDAGTTFKCSKGEIETYNKNGKKLGTAKYEIKNDELKISGAGTSTLLSSTYYR